MKNSLISMSVAALLATNGAFASSVTIPNAFTAGETAVAADVNANFDALAVGVNDNNSRITTNSATIATHTTNIGANTTAIGVNTTAISANAGAISVNAADIATNTADIATNTADIATNAADIATNTADIATNAADIADLQTANGCPSDMVAVGSLCVDIYEASVWDAATAGTQVTANVAITRCAADGHDCGDGLSATAIYARSVADGSILPNRATWYQAAQACANVGKRLPTTAEWQMAAAGTPPNATDTSTPCNVGGTLLATGSAAACVSTSGAFDMVGNLMEWSADVDVDPAALISSFESTDDLIAMALGESKAEVSGAASTKSVYVPGSGPAASNGEIGFRCVK